MTDRALLRSLGVPTEARRRRLGDHELARLRADVGLPTEPTGDGGRYRCGRCGDDYLLADLVDHLETTHTGGDIR